MIVGGVIFGMFGLGIVWVLLWNIWGGILIGLSLIGIAACLKEIPPDPPHLGVITIWRKRINRIKKEGWRFLAPFFPFLYDVIMIDVTAKNQDLPAETIRTPDLAVLEIPVSLTWTPGTLKKESQGEFLNTYINKGKEDRVKTILADIVSERVRSWAMSIQEGPQTFIEAIGSKEEAVEILIKTVAGVELKRIPSAVPTPILFKYFNVPRGIPTDTETKKWGPNWEEVEKIVQQEGIYRIKKAVERRRDEVREIQKGNGVQPIASLGITLNRLNVGDINIKPGTALEKAAEAEVKEKREQAAEKVELEHIRERIGELKAMGYSLKEARDIVQTERDKVGKRIIEIVDLEKIGQGINQAFKK